MKTTELYQKLAAETGVIPWTDLQRHFARGAVVVAAPDMDLVEVAVCVAEDNRRTVEAWITNGQLKRAGDDDARQWSLPGTQVRAVVAAPWVLVQEIAGPNRH